MVQLRQSEAILRCEFALSYQWILAIHAWILAAPARASKRMAYCAALFVHSMCRTYRRALFAVRTAPTRTRDRMAAELLGIPLSALPRVRQLATEPDKPARRSTSKTLDVSELDAPEVGVSVHAKTIADAMSRLNAVVATGRTNLPILDSVHLSVDGDELVMSRTDLEQFATVRIPCAASSFEPVCVPAKELAKILRKQSGTVTIASYQDPDRSVPEVTVSVGGARHSLLGMLAEEFVKHPHAVGDTGRFPGLVAALKQVLPAVSPDESRPILTGVFFDMPGMRLVTTDAHRVHVCDLIGADIVFPDCPKDLQVIVPGFPLTKLAKALAVKEDDEVGIHFSSLSDSDVPTTITFVAHGMELTTRIIDGMFPNVDKVIPDRALAAGCWRVRPAELIAALENLDTVAGEDSRRVKYTRREDELILSAESGRLGASTQPVKVLAGSGIDSLAFNARYMLDALRPVKDAPAADLHLMGKYSQASVTCESAPGYLAVVMPMQEAG